MLMAKEKYPNKVQEAAVKVGIKNQFALRRALIPYKIAEGTARTLWIKGASKDNHHRVLAALAKVLQVDYESLLEEE